MGEIVGIIYLIGFAGTGGWASQHADWNVALLASLAWPIFWPVRLIWRIITND